MPFENGLKERRHTMLLEIKDLKIDFASAGDTIQAVKGVSLGLDKGETLGLVGESGSGKSVTALSIMRLLPPSAQVHGDILFSGSEMLSLDEKALRKIRGSRVAMIFQEPMSSLNPVFRCGEQLLENIQLQQNTAVAEAREKAFSLFEKVKLRDPKRIFGAYPHELSGGQKQRVMLAMALSCNPEILIADEPTTALDVTVQKAILDLLLELKEQDGLSMLFISHDLGVIAEVADRVAVMFQGELVETGSVEQILKSPAHPYTKGLLACRPSLHKKVHRLATIEDFLTDKSFEASVVSTESLKKRRSTLYAPSPILEVKNLEVRYPLKKHFWSMSQQWLDAVRVISFEIYPGEIFGLAGESGCGKTTLGRVINRLQLSHAGSVWFRQLNLEELPKAEFHFVRREIQMVFQDPYASLNPRIPIGQAILEPMKVYALHASDKQRWEKVIELLERVGLEASHANRFPREFSGGQRQRICLARALALQPKLLVCDEIVSALDVSVQATILNLLLDLQEEFGLTYLFISHDLSVIKQMCDRVLVMNQGEIEAIGHPEELFDRPDNLYVRSLVEAIPQGFSDVSLRST